MECSFSCSISLTYSPHSLRKLFTSLLFSHYFLISFSNSLSFFILTQINKNTINIYIYIIFFLLKGKKPFSFFNILVTNIKHFLSDILSPFKWSQFLMQLIRVFFHNTCACAIEKLLYFFLLIKVLNKMKQNNWKESMLCE